MNSSIQTIVILHSRYQPNPLISILHNHFHQAPSHPPPSPRSKKKPQTKKKQQKDIQAPFRIRKTLMIPPRPLQIKSILLHPHIILNIFKHHLTKAVVVDYIRELRIE